jgi:hypothetical protein
MEMKNSLQLELSNEEFDVGTVGSGGSWIPEKSEQRLRDRHNDKKNISGT